MRRLILPLALFCLAALPLWADYGLSNVVTKQIDRGQSATQPPAVQPEVAAPAPGKPPSPAKVPEPAKPEKAPAKAAPEVGRAEFYPFTIHISSWQSKKDALAYYRLKAKKLDTIFITKIDLGATGLWYRIDYGAFASQKEATDRMNDLQARGTIDKEAFVGSSVPYAIEVGVYPSRAEAEKTSQKLLDEGMVTYIVKVSDSAHRVLAGAFPSQKSAGPALEDLSTLGWPSKIAKR